MRDLQSKEGITNNTSNDNERSCGHHDEMRAKFHDLHCSQQR
jgi:hypothetical protein